jgi:DNA-binding MarR family transcriptional regulator
VIWKNQQLIPDDAAQVVDTSDESAARFDELIHAPTRLSLVALLAAAEWAEFKYLRDALELSDSALSKQLSTLEAVGYIHVRKGFVGKRPRTWARLSPAGRVAFAGHVAALQQILRRAGGSGIATGRDAAADDHDAPDLADQHGHS